MSYFVLMEYRIIFEKSDKGKCSIVVIGCCISNTMLSPDSKLIIHLWFIVACEKFRIIASNIVTITKHVHTIFVYDEKKWETGLASRSVNSRKNETNSSSSFPIEILSHSYNFNPSITQNNLIQGFTYYGYCSYPQNYLPDGGVCSLPKTFVVPAPTGGLANKGSLTHWGRDKMAAVFQTVFSNRFSWMKIYEFRLKFHWSLFLRV